MIANFEAKVKRDKRSNETHKKWRTTKFKIKTFLSHQLRKSDISIQDIRANFADQFFDFLILVEGLEDNTAMKYLKNTKQILKKPVSNGWVTAKRGLVHKQYGKDFDLIESFEN